jgi:hypothetical protein
MAVSCVYALTMTVTETLSGSTVPALSASNNSLIHSGYNKSGTLNASSTAPATKCAHVLQALTAGAATIDLTAVQGTQGNVTFSGLKIQLFRATATTGNANVLTLTEGASNGYELAGNTWKVGLLSGQSFMFFGNDGAPDVGGSAKDIDLAGTGSQSVEISIVGG